MSKDLEARLLAVSELRGDFVLSSGKRSEVYYDKFRFLTDPSLLAELADAVSEFVTASGATTVACPEGAAMLLLGPVGIRTGLPMATVRKQAKTYGTGRLVEGTVTSGDRVAVVEDVGTTGAQTLRAIRALKDCGGSISVIVLVIDRGAAEVLRAAGYPVRVVASAGG